MEIFQRSRRIPNRVPNDGPERRWEGRESRSVMEQTKKIESIGIDRLVAHPANPNRMSGAAFKKLVGHIERTGNYEPVIARPHPKRADCFEIINGHHRVEALKRLGCERCDCVVWQVDDTETLMLLATLNRLSGHDVLEKKAELIKALSDRFCTKDLAKNLPDTKRVIERLKDLHKPLVPRATGHKAFLNPLVFFLTDEQKRIVDDALSKATEFDMGGTSKRVAHPTAAQRRAKAIVRMAETFLRINTGKRSDYDV